MSECIFELFGSCTSQSLEHQFFKAHDNARSGRTVCVRCFFPLEIVAKFKFLCVGRVGETAVMIFFAIQRE